MKTITFWFGLGIFIISGIFIQFFIPSGHVMEHDMEHDMSDMASMREHHMSLKNDIIGDLITKGKYKCCLEKPCAYCIEKTPGHGEGATCNCLKDIVEGRHPCGECIGEIMEGHGNHYLSEYFARAIAEEVGEKHLPTLKKIISEKYDISVAEQV